LHREDVEWVKARKKPVEVRVRNVRDVELIQTAEGTLFAFRESEFIIEGVCGEVYPIRKDIFWKTYDISEDDRKRLENGDV